MTDQWTPETSARVKVARALQAKPELMKREGLLPRDLDVIITQGEAAQAADRDQQAQLAQLEVQRTNRKVEAKDLDAADADLRKRMPMVIQDLEEDANTRDQALWVSRLSFSRYRFRKLAPVIDAAAPPTDAEVAVVEKVKRVVRQDAPSRFGGLAAFCFALLADDRRPIVERLAERGISAERLAELAGDAQAVADKGRNVKLAAEATEREEAAARAQRIKWSACEQAIRAACSGDRELALLLADC